MNTYQCFQHHVVTFVTLKFVPFLNHHMSTYQYYFTLLSHRLPFFSFVWNHHMSTYQCYYTLLQHMLPFFPFLESSHEHLSMLPTLQFLVRVNMTPEVVIACINDVSLVAA